MPTYKISPRNSFTVNGRLFFVARTRYMDDGMQVFENKVKNLRPSLTTLEDLRPIAEAVRVFGFWECLLLPDHARKLTCREVARRLVTAWVECNEWVPSPAQRKEVAEDSDYSWWADDGAFYRHWYRHFNPVPASAPEPITA